MFIKLVACALALTLTAPSATRAATIFATEVVAFPGTGVSASRGIGASALGATDGSFLSLGLGGAAVFSFGQLFAGPAAVMEITWGKRKGFLETARLFVGNLFDPEATMFRESDFTEIGTITNEDALASVAFDGTWRYLAFLDISERKAGRDGYDIDSVSVSTVPEPAAIAPVPLPASGLLLGLGIVSLLRLRRRQT